MKSIRITADNSDAIEAALEAVNGRASEHTFSTTLEILDRAQIAEGLVIGLVGSQKAAIGATVSFRSGRKVANSYDYRRKGTWVTLVRRSTGWFLTDIKSVLLNTADGGGRWITLTAAQDAIAIDCLHKRYSVAAEELRAA